MRIARLMFIIGAIALISPIVQAQTFASGQIWHNQRTSTLTIGAIGADGAFTGTFVNQAKGFDCKNSPFAVSGWINGDFISFQVRWKNASLDCNSITTWVGYASAGTVNTQWELVYMDQQTQAPKIVEDTDTFAQ